MKRPFVFICSAMSLDGKIAPFNKEQTEIAVNDDREMLWECRTKADAILIGGNQLRLDDPKLTVKTEERQKQRRALGKTREPIKVSVASDLGTIKNIDGDFFNTGDKKILFTTKKTSSKELEFFKKIAEVYVFGEQRVDLKKALSKLYEMGVRDLMVEGGGELIFSLLEDNLVDEIHLKIGNLILGGRASTTFVDGDGFTEELAKKVEFVDLVKKENYLILKCRLIK